jgi:sugar/nucleoside kinase (ribokinase family)
LAQKHPAVTFIADSRERIGEFRHVLLKPNAREAARATGHPTLTLAGQELYRRAGRPIAITNSEQGMFVFDEAGERRIPAIPVTGPIDVVGAGDSAMSGLMATLCAGGMLDEAALVGNLVASLTVQQLGVTGTATRAEVAARHESLTDLMARPTS